MVDWLESFWELLQHYSESLVMKPRVERNATLDWPKPEMIEAIGGEVRIVNHTSESQFVHKNNHLCRVHLTTDVDKYHS